MSPARDAAKQGVGQRVQRHVGIGMSFQAGIMRHFDVAQRDMRTGGETMHVEAAGHPDVPGFGQAGRRRGADLRRW